MWASAVFIVFGVWLNVKEHKGWGWTMIVLGVLVAVVGLTL